MSTEVEPIKNYSIGIYDGPHATPKDANDGPIFLGIKNVTPGGRLDLTNVKHISEQEFPKWTKRVQPQKNDIVFSYEATLHRYALIPDGFYGCLGRRMALVRPDIEKVDPKYLYYYFLSPKWKAIIEANVIVGATVERIPIKTFPNFEVNFHPLKEQSEIASILSAYDDLIENNQRRIALLEESARLLYREWFVKLKFPGHENTKITDGVPDGWEKATAFDAMEVLSGGTPKTKMDQYWNGGIPFYTPKDSISIPFVTDTEKNLTEEGLNNCSSKLYPKHTLFITARGTVGNLNLALRPMTMNQSCYALKGKKWITQFFLYCAMKETVEHLKQHAVGAVFDAIVVKTFKMIPFLIPTHEVVGDFNSMITPTFKQLENLIKQNQKLKTARDLLLPKLMNGDIPV